MGSRGGVSRRSVIWVALLGVLVVGLTVWRMQGQAGAQASPTLATATRGPIVVTVGGVGRIVEARLPGQSAASSSLIGSSGTGSTAAPANAVFARTSGTISQVLVAPGQRVAAGEGLALISDGGVAAAATRQAEIDVETALAEIPVPARAGTVALAERSVTLARKRLALLRSRADPADLAAATAEVKKARADLAALLKPAPASSAEAIAAARTALSLAEQRLEKLTGPPDPIALATAVAELRKAEADLEALVRSDRTQPVTKKEIDAARAAIDAAKLRLARLQAPPDAADVLAAQLELDRARADLAALLKPQPKASKEAIEAAEQALVAAKEKRRKVRRGATPVEIVAAEVELQRARFDLQTLKETIRGARSSADMSARVGRLKMRSAQNRLEAAREAEEILVVRAPMSGTTSAVYVAPGAHVDPTTPIAAVSDLDNLAVSVDLSEFDVAQVKPGMKAIVSVDALGGEPYQGTVVLVALTGTDNGGIVTFPVRVGLSDSEDLKPGMNTSVRIIVAQKKSVVRVPLEAVTQDEEDRSFVTVLDAAGQEVEKRVEIGLESNKLVEIVKGLSAGARVVLPEVDPALEEE